jgi:uncharacterized RDD family membrane protein YckC
MARFEKQVQIQTPEGIVFPLRIADPLARFLALVIDKVCVHVLGGFLGTILGVLRVIHWDTVTAVIMLLTFILSIGYPIVLEWLWRGQTVGKRVMRLQVMDEQALSLRLHQVIIRNLLRFLDMLPAFYMVGGLCCTLSKSGQRIGDLVANTIVVTHPKVEEPDLEQVLHGKFNSLRAYPHLAARLRQALTPQEAGVAVTALIRRDQLDETARLELFAELRQHLAERVKFPEEATQAISDEQYVRNVVDIAFR